MSKRTNAWLPALLLTLVCVALGGYLGAAEYLSGKVWPEPRVIEPGDATRAPSDAVVLFDGKSLAQWEGGEKWIIKDGYAIANQAAIHTKQGFGSCQFHVEFATPEKVEGEGQGRGNSGDPADEQLRDPDPRFVREQDLL